MAGISANLGFLWAQLPLSERIRRAAAAGFDAVEMHDDWRRYEAGEIVAALRETGLPLVAINSAMDASFGLLALPGRESEARASLREAFDAALRLGAGAVHCLAGLASGEAAAQCYDRNLEWACREAPPQLRLLIEPISQVTPGYFLNSLEQADAVLARHPRLELMFDCFHAAKLGHDWVAAFGKRAHRVGHVQFAGLPDRAEPDRSGPVLAGLVEIAGSSSHAPAFVGAEYRPSGPVEQGLGWMAALRAGMARS